MLYTKGSARTPFNTTDTMLCDPCSEQKIAQFRTNYLTKELAYVSTQQSGQLDTFLLHHFSVYCQVA